MLVDATKLLGCPVLSLHMGGRIARVIELIVDPNDLKVVAFRVDGPEVGGEYGDLLNVKDVREYSEMGMVVDSIDEFVHEGEVVKLKKVLEIGFSLDNKKVETKKGTKLGKVLDYVVNMDNFMVQQIEVARPLMKSFIDPVLLIGRSEIYKITDDKIVVKDEEEKIREKATREDFVPNFVNPFREPRLSTADNQTLDEPGN